VTRHTQETSCTSFWQWHQKFDASLCKFG